MPLEPIADRSLPTSLKVVAWLFIAGGILAAIDMMFSAAQAGFSLNFGVLGLWVGPGLLRLKPVVRDVALILAYLDVVLTPLAGLLFLAMTLSSGGEDMQVTILGEGVDHVPVWFHAAVWSFMAFNLVLSLWFVRVLNRPDVQRLFEGEGREAEPGEADPSAEMD